MRSREAASKRFLKYDSIVTLPTVSLKGFLNYFSEFGKHALKVSPTVLRPILFVADK